MKKPAITYTTVEAHNLLNKIEEEHESPDDTCRVLKEILEMTLSEELELEPDVISGEASILEYKAKELRRLARVLKKDISELPVFINDESPTIKTVVNWRLSTGK